MFTSPQQNLNNNKYDDNNKDYQRIPSIQFEINKDDDDDEDDNDTAYDDDDEDDNDTAYDEGSANVDDTNTTIFEKKENTFLKNSLLRFCNEIPIMRKYTGGSLVKYFKQLLVLKLLMVLNIIIKTYVIPKCYQTGYTYYTKTETIINAKKLFVQTTKLLNKYLPITIGVYLHKKSILINRFPSCSRVSQYIRIGINLETSDEFEKCVYVNISNKKSYEYSNNRYRELTENDSFDNIVMCEDTKQKLINALDVFINHPVQYKKLNIPYKLNILLSGIPGVGKTSIIRALAYHFKINVIFCKNLKSEICFNNDNRVILAHDDFDLIKGVQRRDSVDVANINDRDAYGEPDPNSYVEVFQTLLSELDTPDVPQIKIFTTNHPEKIDSAIVRDGRMDIIKEIHPLSAELIAKYFKLKYPDSNALCDIPKDFTITGAELQNLVVLSLHDSEMFVQLLTEKFNKPLK